MRALLISSAVLLLTSMTHAQAPEPTPVAPAPAPADTPAPPADVSGSAAMEMQATDPSLTVPPPDMPAEESIDPALLGGGGEGQLSAEELEKLGFGGAGGAASAVDTSIKFFGFADFSVVTAAMKKSNPWRGFVGKHSTLYIGNFNFFLSKNLSESVRTMGEVRFLYAPHGTLEDSGNYTVTNAPDHADFDRNLHWGGIEIERLYLEWTMHQYLTIRIGQFLTPYGIWNVDHGSPLFIPVQRPYIIGNALFPERQTGFELYGRYDASAANAIGYHLTLSNGIGPISEIRDLDDNKAVGGRLYWELNTRGVFRLGASAFYGKDTTTMTVRGLDAMGNLTNKERVTAQSKVLSFAADAQYRYKGLHLQAEVISQQREIQDSGRTGAPNPLAGGLTFFPKDTHSWGVYGIVGYRFEWMGVMPYLMAQQTDDVTADGFVTFTRGGALGLNIRPIDPVVIKLEGLWARFPDGSLVSDKDLALFQAQLAWAF